MMATSDPLLSIRQIRAIDAVAHARGFAAAATAIGTSQSSLSRAVREAEAALGAPLFRRGWEGAELTSQGEVVAQACARALSAIRDAEARFAPTARQRSNLLGYLGWPHLDAAAAVLRSGSATAAAAHLRTSQPQVSRLLATLAAAAGQPVFRRGQTGLLAEPAARDLAALRERLRAAILAIPDRLAALSGTVTGRLAVGMTPFSEPELVARAFGALLPAYPRVRFSAVAGSYGMLTDALRRQEIDLVVGALRGLGERGNLHEITLYEERMTVVARRDHAAARGVVAVADLAQNDWIVAPHGTPIRDYFEALFLRAGTAPPVQTCEIVTFDLAEQVILETESLALLMYSDRKAAALRPELSRVQVDLPDSRRPVGVTLSTVQEPAPAAVAFVDWMRANAGR